MPLQRNKRQFCQASTWNSNKELDPNDTAFFEALMSDPAKRELVMQLLSQEKETIAEYKKNAELLHKTAAGSPLKRVKKRAVCESPTALMRRRALEKQIQENRDSPSENIVNNPVHSASRTSETSKASSSSPVSFPNLLKGVIVYVEIRSKDTDRSAGAKALMLSMGATVRDEFTTDVTHVIFKDGSFNTYQKAKLMKVHMVSVLWLEAVRRSRTRVPEKNYPALGTEMFDSNISSICSQLQREYEDVVREDVRRSLAMGTPLPSTKSILSSSNRRRTIMTPFTSAHFNDQFRFSQEVPSTQDKEVDSIMSNKLLTTIFENNATPGNSSVLASPSPDITSDESNCGVIDGDYTASNKRIDSVIFETPDYLDNTNIMKSVENLPTKVSETRLTISDMEITPLHGKNSSSTSNNSKSLIGRDIRKLNLVEKFIETSDMINLRSVYDKENIPKESSDGICISSDKSTNISSENDISKKLANVSKDSSGTNMSSLRISSANSSKTDANKDNHTRKSLDIINSSSANSSADAMVSKTRRSSRFSIQPSKDDSKKDSTGTYMSSLRVSSDSLKRSSSDSSSRRKKTKMDVSDSKRSSCTSMSSLQITGDSTASLKGSKNKTAVNCSSDISNTMSSLRLSDRSVKTSPEKLKPSAKTLERKTAELVATRRKVNGVINKPSKSTSSKPIGNEQKLAVNDSFVTRRSRRKLFSDNKNDMVQGECNSKQNQICKINQSENNSNAENNSNCSSDDSSQISEQNREKRLRKLYNPNESPRVRPSQSDEEQRHAKRTRVKKKLAQGFLDPNSVQLIPIVLSKSKRVSSKRQTDQNVSGKGDATPDKTRKKKKNPVRKSKKLPARNSSADEQKILAEEFLLGKKPRESINKNRKNPESENHKNVQADDFKTPVERGRMGKVKPYAASAIRAPRSSQSLVKIRNNTSLPIEPVNNRRSSVEFQVPVPLSSTKKKIKTNLKLPSIVCTKLHKDDCIVFAQIVKKLGKFVTEDEVSDRTTHLVVGEPKRTINMLRAIARGCWILKHEWLLSSLEHGKWLPEEDYEVTDFSPAVLQCRMQRQAFGSSYSMDIFEGCGPIYIAKSSIPRCSDLKELVSLCKGTVTTISRNAKIIVGEFVASVEVTCVSETWILDSITMNKRKTLKKYVIKE